VAIGFIRTFCWFSSTHRVALSTCCHFSGMGSWSHAKASTELKSRECICNLSYHFTPHFLPPQLQFNILCVQKVLPGHPALLTCGVWEPLISEEFPTFISTASLTCLMSTVPKDVGRRNHWGLNVALFKSLSTMQHLLEAFRKVHFWFGLETNAMHNLDIRQESQSSFQFSDV
jgi:hypothetical protein